MKDLTEKMRSQGFYIAQPIFFNDKEIYKCGNINNNRIYFFEIKEDKFEEIKDEKILEELINRSVKRNSNIVY